jgi:hypothetical protein
MLQPDKGLLCTGSLAPKLQEAAAASTYRLYHPVAPLTSGDSPSAIDNDPPPIG